MKIIHCADLHLDASMKSVIGKAISKVVRENMLVAIRDMYRHAHDIGARAVIIAGDIFDTDKISARTRQYLLGTFAQYQDIVTVILPGNHDGDMVFSREEVSDNVYCFDSSLTAISIDDVVIAGRVLNTTNARQLPLELDFDMAKYNILVLHGQDAGYDNDSDIVVNTTALANRNIDYLALGHIHKHRVAKLDIRGKYCYSGCLVGRGFDECGSKGYVVLDTISNSIEFVPASNIRFERITVDISDATDLKSMELAIEDKVSKCDENTLVNVVLYGNYTVDSGKDIGALTKMFENKFMFFKIDDKSQLQLEVADYQYDISLKGAFVRLVGSDDSLSPEQKDMVLEYGIRALKGEDIV